MVVLMVTGRPSDRLTIYADAVRRAIVEGDAQIQAAREVARLQGLRPEEQRAAHAMVAAALLMAAAGDGGIDQTAAEHLARSFALLRLVGWSP